MVCFGEEVKAFETNFANYYGIKQLIFVENASGFSFYPEKNHNEVLSLPIGLVTTNEEFGFAIATLNKY